MIPAHIVDQVLQTAVIEEVIGDYVELKKSGSALRGLSPFTNEKTPSFTSCRKRAFSSAFPATRAAAW